MNCSELEILPFSKGRDTTMAESRRFKQLTTLEDRLLAWAKKTREHANELEPGPYRDALLKKADQAESTARLKHDRGHPVSTRETN